MNIEFAKEVIDAVTKYEKCIDVTCKRETATLSKTLKKQTKHVQALQNKLTKKQITIDEFRAEVDIIKTNVKMIDAVNKKNTCIFTQCKSDVLAIFPLLLKKVQGQCNSSKSAYHCDMVNTLMTIKDKVEKETLTKEDIVQLAIQIGFLKGTAEMTLDI
jgi:septal ring factor EnvC (AmiA/AmiB activator)